jgi:hypothetical protein
MTRRAARRGGFAALAVAAAAAHAQAADSGRVGPRAAAPADTTTAPLAQAPKPPVSAKRALFQSLLLPGWGQASLDRGTAGTIFVAVEAMSVAMLMQSRAELRAAQAAVADSTFVPPSAPGGTGSYLPNPLAEVVGKRQQAVEDWKVLLIFNHLIAAADAFVAAQLWSVPIEVHGSPSRLQATVSTHVRW